MKIEVELTKELYRFIQSKTGDGTLYTSPEDYLRSSIRSDFEKHEVQNFAEHIMEGMRDVVAGRTVEFKGNLRETMEEVKRREAEGWQ